MTTLAMMASASPNSAALVVNVPRWETFWAGHEEAARAIATQWGGPEHLRSTLIVRALGRFASFVFLAPCSDAALEGSHDGEPGGMIAHSFATTSAILRLAGTRPELDANDRLALLILAVLHDIGRLWQMEVRCVEPAVAKEDLVWEPHYEGMAKWAERIQAKRISISWMGDRKQVGERSTEAVGASLISEFFNKAYIPLLGRRRYNSLIKSFARSIGPTSRDYYGLLKAADATMAKQSREAAAAGFWTLLGRAITEIPDLVDGPEAEVVVSRSHAIVALPGPGIGQVWTAAMTAMGVDDIKQGSAQARLLGDGKTSLVRWPGADTCDLRAIHLVQLDDGRRLRAIVVPRDLLKAGLVDANLPETTRALSLLLPDGSGPSCDPMSVGFQVLPLTAALQSAKSVTTPSPVLAPQAPIQAPAAPTAEAKPVGALSPSARKRLQMLTEATQAALKRKPEGGESLLLAIKTNGGLLPADRSDQALQCIIDALHLQDGEQIDI